MVKLVTCVLCVGGWAGLSLLTGRFDPGGAAERAYFIGLGMLAYWFAFDCRWSLRVVRGNE